jgi:fido (protein-threonine AMPylation protein)
MSLLFLEVDEQLQKLRSVESRVSCREVVDFGERFLDGWIYHDLCLEGRVFRSNELQRALAGREGSTWRENQLLDKVRYCKRTIRYLHLTAERQGAFDLDFVKQVHRILQPDNDDRAGRYRKEGPENSAYRHDVTPASGISYRLRKLIAAVEADRPTTHPITTACMIHRQLIEISPFYRDNGLLARMLMNSWLIRWGYTPAVIRAQARQRYFDAYLSPNGSFRELIVDSMVQGMDVKIRGLSGGYAAVACSPLSN